MIECVLSSVAPGVMPQFPPGLFPFWAPFPGAVPPAAPPAAQAAPSTPQTSTDAAQTSGAGITLCFLHFRRGNEQLPMRSMVEYTDYMYIYILLYIINYSGVIIYVLTPLTFLFTFTRGRFFLSKMFTFYCQVCFYKWQLMHRKSCTHLLGPVFVCMSLSSF